MGLILLFLRFWYGKVCCQVYNDSWPALSYDLTMQEDILDLLLVIFFAYMFFILSDFYFALVRGKVCCQVYNDSWPVAPAQHIMHRQQTCHRFIHHHRNTPVYLYFLVCLNKYTRVEYKIQSQLLQHLLTSNFNLRLTEPSQTDRA